MNADTSGALLSSYFHEQAAWYRNCGHDDHARATSLDSFADYLERLPDDDLRAIALRQLAGCERGPFTLAPGPHLSSSIARIDDYHSGIYDAFLDLLVHAAVNDSLEQEAQPVCILIDSLSGASPQFTLR